MAILLVALSACAVDSTPNVQVISDEPVMATAAHQWHELGYAVGEIDAPECHDVRDALAGEPCVVSIVVQRWPMLKERYGTYAMSDRETRLVVIDSRFTDYYDLLTMGTHEMGHILLDAGHLEPGEIGVMSESGVGWTPTDADYALACRSVGAGC